MINQAMQETAIDSQEETLPYCSIYIDSTVPSPIVGKIIGTYGDNAEFIRVFDDTPSKEFDEADVYLMHAIEEYSICDIAENIRKRNSRILLIAISDGGSTATPAIDMRVPISIAPETILAYIKAGLRRIKMEEEKLFYKPFISSADRQYTLDPLSRVFYVSKTGVQINLSPSEFGIIRCLVENQGEYTSSEGLNNTSYSDRGNDSAIEFKDADRVRLTISRLRKKFEAEQHGLGEIIKNGVREGYKLI